MNKIIIKFINKITEACPKKIVKEIRTKSGFLCFRRSQILNLKIFSICIHEFFQQCGDTSFDKDIYLHDHPYEFYTLVLRGGYEECSLDIRDIKNPENKIYKIGSLRKIDKYIFHRIHSITNDCKLTELLGIRYCKTLCFIGPRNRNWGYLLQDRKTRISNEEFRSIKKTLPQNPTYDFSENI